MLQAAPTPQPITSHQNLANCLRFLSADAVEKAKSGHPGMPMGMSDVATVLWQEFLKFDAANPEWPNRDRFVLSAGHGSMLLYSLLYLTGFEDMPLEQLRSFRQWGSHTAGHPEYGVAGGIETTTGPLGQGISTAVGMALGEKMLKEKFGPDLVNYKTYVMASDGDLMEGITQESCSLAGHLQLNNLIVLYDDNNISIDGSTDLSFSDNTSQRFEGLQWHVLKIDGHNDTQIRQALTQAQTSDRPVLICCKTTIGKGAPTKAGSASSHGSPLGSAEIQTMREQLNWPHAPFEIPEELMTQWRAAGHQHHKTRLTWEDHLAVHPERVEFSRRSQMDPQNHLRADLPKSTKKIFEALINGFIDTPESKGTRLLSQAVLEAIAPEIPELIGGSADLTGSNNTKATSQGIIDAPDYAGQYLHYGVREHGMAAIMNGLSLTGFRPYGGTFLIFSDYLRPALRLSALMHQPVVYVLTHDSIGLGEDGPTHQPIEHLANLRAIPNLNVFRPADGVEVTECWQLALESHSTPSVIALSRQNIIPVRLEKSSENLSKKGGYVLREAQGGNQNRDVTLIATGSEVGLAVKVGQSLEDQGIQVAVVSMPCTRLFDEHPKSYQESILGSSGLRVVIEAASSFGWHKYVGLDGLTCCLDHFGASAPADQLYDHFGFTVEKICHKIQDRLGI